MQKGDVFIWCDEAVVYESVPPDRWSRTFMLQRALLRGAIAVRRDGVNLRSVGKCLIAVPLYIVALPFAFVLGQHRFMSLLIRLCDHIGMLLTLVGLTPIKNEYVTD